MLSINPCPPTGGREKGGEGTETNKLNIIAFTDTNNTNNINNRRNKTKYTKTTWFFLELGARRWCPASSCQAASGSL